MVCERNSEIPLTAREYKSLVASFGCIICQGPAELHHMRTGMGAGQRNDDFHILPLCALHHRLGGAGIAYHAGSKTWESIHGTEIELHEQLNEQIEGARRFQSI